MRKYVETVYFDRLAERLLQPEEVLFGSLLNQKLRPAPEIKVFKRKTKKYVSNPPKISKVVLIITEEKHKT